MTQLDLLPAADAVVKCADFTAALDVDPGGTAIRADLLIAAETPLPWPKPVFDHPRLEAIPEIVDAAVQPTRVLAAVPRSTDAFTVVAYRRSRRVGERPQRTEWRTDEQGIRETIVALVAGEDPAGADAVVGAGALPEIWVCTQGSHDLCCGSYGTRLAEEVDRSLADRVTLRRVSHTGGHRFAPTALMLPSGRMWAYLDVDGVEAILDAADPPSATLVDTCRGWWGADPGPAQMAERVGLAIFGWSWNHAMRDVAVVDRDERQVTTVEVRALLPDGSPARYRVGVAVARDVPSIACRAPGGLPAKPGRELAIVDIQML